MIVKLSLVVVNVDKPLVEGHTLRGGMNQMFENHVRVAIMYVTMKLDGPCWGKLELWEIQWQVEGDYLFKTKHYVW